MNHIRSSLSDLRQLFERTITIRDIATSLVSFDADHCAQDVRQVMDASGFDVVGVRKHGKVVGYARHEDLGNKGVGDTMVSFNEADIFNESERTISALEALRTRSAMFVTVLGNVGGIITRADLQKSPVRMWLFGLISLIEMQMLRLIRERYYDETWRQHLNEKRVADAQRVFKLREAQNEQIDLLDCLQLCDKRDICCGNPELLKATGFSSSQNGVAFLKSLESLRNALAHANDIVQGRWPELADLALEAEKFLERLEHITLVE
jgi:CBS domain-containing protein